MLKICFHDKTNQNLIRRKTIMTIKEQGKLKREAILPSSIRKAKKYAKSFSFFLVHTHKRPSRQCSRIDCNFNLQQQRRNKINLEFLKSFENYLARTNEAKKILF